MSAREQNADALQAYDRNRREAYRAERMEAESLLASQGHVVLWTPAVGRVTVTSLAAWDAAMAERPRPQKAAS